MKSKKLPEKILIACMITMCATPMFALKTAAGGTSGSNGFHEVAAFLDHLATYVIWLSIPAGVLGLIAAGGMMLTGNPDGTSWLARIAIGVGIILLSKGIMS